MILKKLFPQSHYGRIPLFNIYIEKQNIGPLSYIISFCSFADTTKTLVYVCKAFNRACETAINSRDLTSGEFLDMIMAGIGRTIGETLCLKLSRLNIRVKNFRKEYLKNELFIYCIYKHYPNALHNLLPHIDPGYKNNYILSLSITYGYDELVSRFLKDNKINNKYFDRVQENFVFAIRNAQQENYRKIVKLLLDDNRISISWNRNKPFRYNRDIDLLRYFMTEIPDFNPNIELRKFLLGIIISKTPQEFKNEEARVEFMSYLLNHEKFDRHQFLDFTLFSEILTRVLNYNRLSLFKYLIEFISPIENPSLKDNILNLTIKSLKSKYNNNSPLTPHQITERNSCFFYLIIEKNFVTIINKKKTLLTLFGYASIDVFAYIFEKKLLDVFLLNKTCIEKCINNLNWEVFDYILKKQLFTDYVNNYYQYILEKLILYEQCKLMKYMDYSRWNYKKNEGTSYVVGCNSSPLRRDEGGLDLGDRPNKRYGRKMSIVEYCIYKRRSVALKYFIEIVVCSDLTFAINQNQYACLKVMLENGSQRKSNSINKCVGIDNPNWMLKKLMEKNRSVPKWDKRLTRNIKECIRLILRYEKTKKIPKKKKSSGNSTNTTTSASASQSSISSLSINSVNVNVNKTVDGNFTSSGVNDKRGNYEDCDRDGGNPPKDESFDEFGRVRALARSLNQKSKFNEM